MFNKIHWLYYIFVPIFKSYQLVKLGFYNILFYILYSYFLNCLRLYLQALVEKILTFNFLWTVTPRGWKIALFTDVSLKFNWKLT